MSEYDERAYVRGVRAFALEGTQLASPVWSEPAQLFVPGPNQAICAVGMPGLAGRMSNTYHARGAIAPAPGCACGLYSCHDLPALTRRFVGHVDEGSERVVRAAVRMWGEIEVHADGCRAQWMEVVAIGAADDAERALLAPVAAVYGVPIVSQARLDDVAAEHGQAAPGLAATRVRPDLRALASMLATGLIGALAMWVLPTALAPWCLVTLIGLSMWYLCSVWTWAGRPLDWRYTSGDPLPRTSAHRRWQMTRDP